MMRPLGAWTVLGKHCPGPASFRDVEEILTRIDNIISRQPYFKSMSRAIGARYVLYEHGWRLQSRVCAAQCILVSGWVNPSAD